jgi:peptidoglycan/xylan/chitin deacetylase (PgdA/CDA1 family)/type 1 fimbria pilin
MCSPLGRVATRGAGRVEVRAFLALAALLVTSCGDDGAAPVVPVPTSLLLEPSAVVLEAIGQSEQVRARVLDQDGRPMPDVPAEWVSDDPAVASVSPTGSVTAVANGATTIRVGAGDVEATLTVTVTQRVVALAAGTDSLLFRDPGDTATVTVAARDAEAVEVDEPGIVWASSDTSVARVSETGHVEAVGTGTAELTVTAGTASATVTVRVRPPLVLVAVGLQPLQAAVDEEVSLMARVEDALGALAPDETVSWTVSAGSGALISPPEVASDQSGLAQAVWRLGTEPGMQQAFATIESRGAPVKVEFVAEVAPGEPVAAILAADSVLLSGRGESVTLAPAYEDAFGNPTEGSGVTWSSRDPGVATVDGDGRLTAGSVGSTWIVASLAEPTDSILVTVERRGAITVTFDDGFRSVYENAWPLFQEFDLPANIAVNAVPIDLAWEGYLTPVMLDELAGAGWSIVSHTLEHDSLPTLSPAELDYDLRTSQQWIVDRGYRGWNVFVAPYHAYGPDERAAVAQYYDASRGMSSSEFVPDSIVSWMPDDPHQLTGREADLLPYTTPSGRSELRTLLQRVVDEGGFLDIFFHQVPPENVDALRELVLVLADFRSRVLPYHELFPVLPRVVN